MDLKLFRVETGCATEVAGAPVALESDLQVLVERNMEAMLGVRFLATEFPTGDGHGGRIDSLGLDETGSPVIIEYKKDTGPSVMNQALFYLDWLLDHPYDFQALVQRVLSDEVAEAIDWSRPRMICIASDFTRYDRHAVRRLGQSMDLVRYHSYDGGALFTLTLEESSASHSRHGSRPSTMRQRRQLAAGVSEVDHLSGASPAMLRLFGELDSALLDLGDVQRVSLQTCLSYRTLKGFAWVVVQKRALVVTLPLNPKEIELRPGFTRDLSGLGHHGGGDLEVRIRSTADIRAANDLFHQSFGVA
ncbi:DUF5655 domain-containing protein [Streptomyces sp. NRRL S-337]|uniref:DUF5655 domain-containing protein n=1 Tax=Streptomyces sp. NRRL S-337 TaxID=1463900 RepID=UPI0004C71A5E|nr:DUF5655 domain-containing protein [Streptomyces sp. NRRL S-337]